MNAALNAGLRVGLLELTFESATTEKRFSNKKRVTGFRQNNAYYSNSKTNGSCALVAARDAVSGVTASVVALIAMFIDVSLPANVVRLTAR